MAGTRSLSAQTLPVLSAAPAETPPASHQLLYVRGGSVYRKDSTGAEIEVGGTGGGGGGTSGADYTLTTEHGSTTPAAPSTGVKMFARHRARRLPAVIGPNGLDTALQPAFFTNRIARLNAINGVATPQFDGLAVTNVANPVLQSVATTGFYQSMVRTRYSSAATANAAGGFRSSTAQWMFSSNANQGGFFWVLRFGLGVVTATNRIFLGMSTTTGALSGSTQSTALTNMVGFGADNGHANFRFMHNDSTGTATSVDLGSNFPCTTGSAQNFFEFRLFAPSGAGQVVYWSATRLNNGDFVQGQATTDLPAVNTLLATHVHHGNGGTATAVSIDVQSLYIENDN